MRQVGGVVDADADARGARASSASLAGPTTSLLMWMSRTPAATKGRASLTFWQQMPRAPSASWQRDLGTLAWPQRHAVAVGPGLHGAQVGLEGRQVQRQAGRVDARQRIAGLGGGRQRYAAYDFLGHRDGSVFRSNIQQSGG